MNRKQSEKAFQSNGKLENTFKSLEQFTSYMESFKKAIKIDEKLRIVLHMMLTNIMNTFFESIELAVKHNHIKKPFALVLIHRFSVIQRDNGSLGHVFGIEVNVSEVAKACGIIPNCVEILDVNTDDDDGYGLGIAVEKTADKKIVEQIVKDFGEADGFELELDKTFNNDNTARA